MGERERRLDEIRTERTPLENHLIDELRSGHIGRREFIRRGTVVGMSVPLLGLIASACGVSREEIEKKDPAQTGTPERGGTIRAGIIQPAGALDPITVADQGGLGVLGQSGEYLIWSDRDLKAQPRLAESWSPTEGGRVWRFKIRQGVTFHDGTPMDAEDVASTFNRLADPDAGSNALSVFSGVLSKGNAKAVDGTTVEFQLDAPNGNFPFLVSSDNYNAIILPKDLRRRLGEDVHRHRAVEALGVPARRGRQLRPEPRVLGQGPDPDQPTSPRSASTRPSSRRSSGCSATRSTCSSSSPSRAARRC